MGPEHESENAQRRQAMWTAIAAAGLIALAAGVISTIAGVGVGPYVAVVGGIALVRGVLEALKDSHPFAAGAVVILIMIVLGTAVGTMGVLVFAGVSGPLDGYTGTIAALAVVSGVGLTVWGIKLLLTLLRDGRSPNASPNRPDAGLLGTDRFASIRGSLECPVCGWRFRRDRALQEHMARAHPKAAR